MCEDSGLEIEKIEISGLPLVSTLPRKLKKPLNRLLKTYASKYGWCMSLKTKRIKQSFRELFLPIVRLGGFCIIWSVSKIAKSLICKDSHDMIPKYQQREKVMEKKVIFLFDVLLISFIPINSPFLGIPLLPSPYASEPSDGNAWTENNNATYPWIFHPSD